jgi:hypothetical protein
MSVTLYRNVYRFPDGATTIADAAHTTRTQAKAMRTLLCCARPDVRPAYLLVIKPRLELARA